MKNLHHEYARGSKNEIYKIKHEKHCFIWKKKLFEQKLKNYELTIASWIAM